MYVCILYVSIISFLSNLGADQVNVLTNTPTIITAIAANAIVLNADRWCSTNECASGVSAACEFEGWTNMKNKQWKE